MSNPNPKNQFKPGVVTNPKGRPKGKKVDDIGLYIRNRLAKIPAGKNKRYIYYLVQSLLKKGINDGDAVAMRELLDRAYGKSNQKIDVNINPTTKLQEALSTIDEYELVEGEVVDDKEETKQIPAEGT